MKTQITDAGRIQGEKRDCTVRAWALFTTMPYQKAHQMLSGYRKPRHGCQEFRKFLKDNFLMINEERTTLKRFVETHPVGRFMIRTRNHVRTLINGVFYDTFEARPREVLTYYVKAGQ